MNIEFVFRQQCLRVRPWMGLGDNSISGLGYLAWVGVRVTLVRPEESTGEFGDWA